MDYISERIVNIADLEKMQQSAQTKNALLSNELNKDNPDIAMVKELSKQINKELDEISKFEFCIERRKIYELQRWR